MATALLRKKQNPASLHRLMFVLQHMSNEMLLDYTGVGLSAALIMSTLSKSTPLSQRAIASSLRQSEANVSRQLQVMKKQGLVSVRQSRQDKRQREVVLTAKGATTHDKALQLLDKQQKDILQLIEVTEAKVFSQTVDNLLRGLQLN